MDINGKNMGLSENRITKRQKSHGLPSLIGGLEHGFYFFIQLGISSSQLTFSPSFFRRVAIPPTR
jgi:hypothetical protein